MATYLFTDGDLKKIEIKNFRLGAGFNAEPGDSDYEEQHAKFTPGGKANTHREKLEEKLGIKVTAWVTVKEG